MLQPIIRGRPDENHTALASYSQDLAMPPKTKAKSSPKRWSQHVTETSNALDLDPGVFSWSDPNRIAASLKRSAESSKRRKGSPLQSAMSMLNFYINRAGHTLPAKQKRILEKTKDELHQLFGESSPVKS
jgi:predicted trehalose synthase